MTEEKRLKKKVIHAIKFAAAPSILMLAIHILKSIKGYSFASYGVFPRELDGLLGIFTSPMVHGDWEHLFSNILPFFMLCFMIAFFYRRISGISFIMMYVMTGFMVWFLARPVYHIGASGVVYALVSFVFWTGVFRRNVKSIVLALSVLVLYSGYFLGIVPFKEGVSWESHLFGGIVGIIVAFIFKSHLEYDEIRRDPWANEWQEEEVYFLKRDIFEKTKLERKLEQEEKFFDPRQPF